MHHPDTKVAAKLVTKLRTMYCLIHIIPALLLPRYIMKTLLTYFLLALLPVGQAMAVDTEKLTQNSRAAAKALGGELKAVLQASMKSSGPVKSLSICRESAPAIAEKVSTSKGLTVGRTSLKYRNPNNKPDAWETSVLQKFEQRKANGEAADKLEFSEVTDHNGKQVFRYMKAIPAGEVCLKCHGGSIAEPIRAELDKLYPGDKARGFNKGDIRGAFTVIQPVN